MNRAFHIAGLVWFCTILVVKWLAIDPLVGAFLGAMVLAGLIIKGKLPLWVYAAGTAFCASMVSLLVYDAVWTAPVAQYAGTTQTIRGVVEEVQHNGSYADVIVKTEASVLPKELSNIRIRMAVNGGLDASVGDVVEYKARLSCDADEKSRLYAQDIHFRGAPVGAVVRTGERKETITVKFAHYRDGMAENILRQLPNVEGAVLVGMLLGDTAKIPQQIRNDYARTGISHLLSVSGLHLAVLIAIAEVVMRHLPISRRQRGFLLMTAVGLLIGLAGFSHSILRAGLMMLLYLSAGLFGRDSDSLNSLGLALIFILLFNPYAALGLSLQLSYLATLGIVAFSSPMSDWLYRRIWRMPPAPFAQSRCWSFTLIQAVSTTLCACLLTASLICYTFGELSSVSPLVNLLILPLEPIALGFGLLCGLSGFSAHTMLLSRAFGFPAGLAAKGINGIASEWASLPFASVPVRGDYAIAWLTAAIACGILLWLIRAQRPLRRYTACMLGLCLLAGAFTHSCLHQNTLRVAVANNGDTVTLIYGRQGVVLGAPHTVGAAEQLYSLLRSHGVDRIPLLVSRTDDALFGNPVGLLAERLPIETAFGLDRTFGFEAELFGHTKVSVEGADADFIQVETQGLRIFKSFEQIPLAADLMMNARNEIICAPYIKLHIHDRYFGSSIFALKGEFDEIPAGE